MRKTPPLGAGERRPTAFEQKSEQSTKAARSINEAETAARERKTQKLREARLAKENGGGAD